MVAGRPSALIADDDEFFRAALSAILTKQLGFATVFEAASLDEALEELYPTGNFGRILRPCDAGRAEPRQSQGRA